MRAARRRPGAALPTGILLAALLALPLPAAGKVLGIVYPESCGFYDAATEALKAHLAANGFGPTQLEIFVQKPAADPMSWTNAVRKFSAVEADLVVVWGDALLQTACQEKIKTPVGFGFVSAPELAACVRSPANPSGSAAGVSGKTPLATLLARAKLLADFKTVGALDVAGDRVGRALIEELRALEKEIGYATTVLPVEKRDQAAAALKAGPQVGLLMLPGCPLVAGQVEELLAVAAARGIPTAALQPPRGGAAPLIALYPSPEEQGRLLGEVAVAIFKGGRAAAPAAALTPKKVELEVNLPLARQLGLKVPMALLESATKIVK